MVMLHIRRFCHCIYYDILCNITEGSLEVKLPAIWTDEKQRWEESEKRREEKRREENIKKTKSPKKEDPGARKGSTFWSWDVKKVHAVVARSTFPSQNVQNTPGSDHFLKLRCRKSLRPCGAKHISKSKCTKHTRSGPPLEVEMWKKCTRLWREGHFEVKMHKTPHVRATFGCSDVVSRGRRKGLRTLSRMRKTWGFCSSSKKRWQGETFEEDLQRWIFRGRRSTRDMFVRAVRRSGRWFPEKGCILEHQIFSFGKMILRERCSTSYDLASLFRGKRSTLDRWIAKIAKLIGTRLSAPHSTFHFGKKSRRLLSFLMLSPSKIEEVSQNCFVFDIVKFNNCGSLAELYCLWCCQIQLRSLAG